jgi:hypothetical protein
VALTHLARIGFAAALLLHVLLARVAALLLALLAAALVLLTALVLAALLVLLAAALMLLPTLLLAGLLTALALLVVLLSHARSSESAPDTNAGRPPSFRRNCLIGQQKLA